MTRKFPLALIRKFQPYSWFLTEKARRFSQSEMATFAEKFKSDQSNVQVDYMDAPHDLYHYQSDAIVSRTKEILENNWGLKNPLRLMIIIER